MKKIVLTLLVILNCTIIFAQQKKVSRVQKTTPPAPVQQAFKKDNPNVDDAQWKQRNNQWGVNYNDKNNNNSKAIAFYDKRGKAVDSHIVWNKKDVPKELDNKIYSKFHTRNYKVYKVERHGRTPLFQFELSSGGTIKTIYTDERGNEVNYGDRH